MSDISTITPLPDPPTIYDAGSFDVRADSFLSALPVFVTQLNSLITILNQLIIDELWDKVNYAIKTGNYDAEAGDKILADTSSQSFTIKLPANPEVGSFVRICDLAGTFGTNFLIVDGNGKEILGSQTFMLDTDNVVVTFLYSGATYGWKIA